MNVLGLITARGGSKGIPQKNLVPFLGKPLIAWTILSAQAARSVTRIIVSSDDEAINATAREWGAETPFIRPPELALDDTPDLPVFEHAIQWLANEEGYRPDILVHLRPTTPLRPSHLIDEAVDMLAARADADSVRSVCVPQNNPFKMWRILDDGVMRPLIDLDLPEPYNQPRQKLPAHYWQTGTVDVTRTETVTEKKSMTGDTILPLVVDAAIAVDIDDPLSLAFAEERCRLYGMGT